MEVKIECLEKQKIKISTGKHTVFTDLPQTLGGDDSAMPPPELMLAALGACLGVYIKRYLAKNNINYSKISLIIKSEIADKPVRRMQAIDIIFDTDAKIKNKAEFISFVKNCPIHNTITGSPEIKFNLDNI